MKHISQLIRVMPGFVPIWTFSVQIYSGFRVIAAGIYFMETSDNLSKILWSSHRPCSQIWHLCVTYVTYVEGFVHQLWHMTGFQLFWANRDGCHMWGRKCSLFPEHMILFHLGSSWLTHSLYIHYLSVWGLCLGINYSGLFALTAFF